MADEEFEDAGADEEPDEVENAEDPEAVEEEEEADAVDEPERVEEKAEFKLRKELPHDLPPEDKIYSHTVTIQIVADADRKTSDILQKNEYAQLLAIMADYVSKHGISEFKMKFDGLDSPIRIAEKIILARKCPFLLRRMVAKNIIEEWDVNQMAITPSLY